jgi:hypothetical protein
MIPSSPFEVMSLHEILEWVADYYFKKVGDEKDHGITSNICAVRCMPLK